MSFLLGRTVCALRGPLGQQLPRSLVSSSSFKGQSILTQVTSMSTVSSSPLLSKGKQETMGMNGKYQVMKIPVRYSSEHGNHVALWTAERAVSAAMIPIIPLAFIFPSATMDYLLALTIAVHSHWGIEAIVVDYVRPSVFGNAIPKLALGGVYLLSALTLGGLCYFIYTDVGIVNAIKLLWKL